MSPQSWGYVLAAAATLAWGLAVIPVKAARSPGSLGIAVSMPAGLLVLAPLLAILWPGRDAVPALTWKAALAVGAAGLCQFPLATVCYYEAIRRAEVSVVAPLKCLKTLLVLGWVLLLGIEPLTPRLAVAAGAGVLGAAILTGGRIRGGAGGRRAGALTGAACALLACVFWSAGDVLMREAVRTVPPLPATAAALACGILAYTGWLAARGRLGAVRALPRRDLLCYAAHGALSFAVGYGAFFAALRALGVTRAVVITSAWPLVSLAVGVALFRESFGLRKGLGVALLLASVYLVVFA